MDSARISRLECENTYLFNLALAYRELLREWFYEFAHRRNENDKVSALFQRTGLELVKPMKGTITMTDLQNQLIDKLRAYWEKHPEVRLGQMIVAGTRAHGPWDTCYIRDADLLRGLEKLEEE